MHHTVARQSFVLAVGCLALTLTAMPARAQLFVTGVSATQPDPGGKLPAFNAVPGAQIPSWSSGLAMSVLTHGQSYEYCVSLASGTAAGKAGISYKILRGTTVIQADNFVSPSKFTVSSNGIWYYCAGYHVLPNSPGAATLVATADYTATGATKGVVSKLSVPLILQ